MLTPDTFIHAADTRQLSYLLDSICILGDQVNRLEQRLASLETPSSAANASSASPSAPATSKPSQAKPTKKEKAKAPTVPATRMPAPQTIHSTTLLKVVPVRATAELDFTKI